MAKKIYIGANSVAKKIKKAYIGIDSETKQIKKAYIGVNGVAKLCFSTRTYTTQTFNVTGSGVTGASGSRTVTVTKYLTLDHIPISGVHFNFDVNDMLEEILDVHVIEDHDNVVKATIDIRTDNTFVHQYRYDLDIDVHYYYE